MSALELIKDYENSSSSEEENSTVQVLPLPLPDDIKNLYADDIDENYKSSDNLHQGRIRSFAHQRGNWSTHVFIPYPYKNLLSFMDEINVFLSYDKDGKWKTMEGFHLSLSKTVVIPHHCIEPMQTCLKESLHLTQSSHISFTASHLRYYTNEEKTRSFLGFEIRNPAQCEYLSKLVDRVDGVMREFNCAAYYQEPSYHISVAWCLGDVHQRSDSTAMLESFKTALSRLEEEEPGLFCLEVNKIMMKTGNKLFVMPLLITAS